MRGISAAIWKGSILGGAFLLLPLCARITTPPLPPGVPAGAHRQKQGLWEYTGDDGSFRLYYPDGKIAQTGEIQIGVRRGVWKSYSLDTGKVTSIGLYRNDWRDGVWKYYDTGGRLYYTVTYAPEPKQPLLAMITHDYGNENGPYERFFPDGTLEERGAFYAGLYEGEIVRYYKNGKKAVEGRYKSDKMDGIWRYYYPEGGLERIETFRNGVLDGELKRYRPDGKLFLETRYSAGRESGPARVYVE